MVLALGQSLESRDTVGSREAEKQTGLANLPNLFSRLFLLMVIHVTPKVSFSKVS